jgi:hypothetical protein
MVMQVIISRALRVLEKKRPQKLLAEYESLENVLKNAAISKVSWEKK